MHYLLIVILALIPLCVSSESFCEKLEETLLSINDNVAPMTMNSPFNIVTSVSTAQQSEILTIRVKSILSELNFGGFMIHARTTRPPYEILGRFTSSSEGLELSNCGGNNNTATYHAHSDSEIALQWQAPNYYVGEILFEGIIAQDFDKFWVGITSTPVVIVPRAGKSIRALISSAIRSHVPKVEDQLPSISAEERNTIYEGCGTTKSCFGLPNNCIEQQSCQAVATAFVVGNRYQFELKSNDDLVTYVGLGLSKHDRAGEESVMECVLEEGTVRAYTSYNNPMGNTREGVPQNIISLLDASYANGTIYCKLERPQKTTVLGVDFDLMNDDLQFSLFYSMRTNTSPIRYNLAGIASTKPLDVVDNLIDDSIYVGCGTTKTCIGMPQNCLAQQACNAVVTAAFVNNQFEFELKSNSASISYIALGLSENNQMDYDSVMECVQDGGAVSAYSSWNDRRENTRIEIPQDIIRLQNASFVDGTIYCKLERDNTTIIRDTPFNLLTQNYYFLLATGTIITPTQIIQHNIGFMASAAPVEIIGTPPVDDPREPIYEGCGTNKTCFGMPTGCVEARSCAAIVTAAVVDEKYEFELESANVIYVSFALSRDNLMGGDSVIECIAEQGNVRAFTSWNPQTPRLTNTRVGVSPAFINLRNSAYINGTIYCKVERDVSSVVLGNPFNLAIEDFHFMLAIGTGFTNTGIMTHDLGRLASSEPINFRGSAQLAAQVSVVSIIVWLLATSCTQFLRGL